MARTHRNLTAWSGVVFAALLLGGCTGETPSPPPTPAPTTESASPTPTPTPKSVMVPPARPAAMDDEGQAGAEAAAVYFMELDPYIQATGDTTVWDSMSHSTCEYCANRAEQANTIAGEGDLYEGGETVAQIVRTYQQDEATGIWPIDVEVVSQPSTITSSSGDVLFETDESTDQMHAEVFRRDGQWVIATVSLAG